MKVAVVVLAGLLGLVVGALAEGQQLEQSEAASAMSQAELDEALDANLKNRRIARVFALVSSTSITRLTTTTITALSTCLSVATGTSCTGRKKRSIFNSLSDLEELTRSAVELEGSQNEEEVAQSKKTEDNRLGKRFTIWSSNFTTLTVTSTSFVAGTTVTASALCTAPGVTAGCFG